ncbi:MAG: putrescine aminotransferase [Firmicutes bacterium HGW-Firmicutes-16]|nr:MAG: putrescine aminotransferase [Firmicutes bacterium HGW-Firmicutes-16]
MKKNYVGGKIFAALTYVFLYAPIVVLIVFSFNSTKSRTIWSGFTLNWYKELFNDSLIMSSLQTTITVSVIASVAAAVIGTFAAIGFFNMKKNWRSPLLLVNNIPVVNADIITGVSLSLLFVSVGAMLHFELGFGTLLIAHISFDIPYVILSVMPKLYQLDRNLFEAAQDLGCTWFQTIYKAIIPEIMPGIINGLLIAFTMSVDDFVISYFTAGSSVQTLSMTIYAMTRRRISPKINAISTLLFAVVLILLVIVNVRESRQYKAEIKKDKVLKGVLE